VANDAAEKPITQPIVTVPGLGAVLVVVVKLPDGSIALRHPSELQKTVVSKKAGA